MPRAPRATLPGGIHHVINRCNHQERLLQKGDLQDLCSLLAETKRRFGLQLFAYAFLQNHYHLLLKEPSTGSLSAAMRWFGQVSAIRYNVRHNMSGHLWQGRFKNRVIQDDRDFLQCMIYIDLNPARARLAEQVIDWPFSSANAHVNQSADPLLDPTPIELSNYKQILSIQWEVTNDLRRAIEKKNRASARDCLRQLPSKRYIPWSRELSLLCGAHFRDLISRSKKSRGFQHNLSQGT